MLKKSIAAAMLVVVAAWAEMAMAPMFLMHAGLMRPATGMSEHVATHHHAMPAGHPCCPGLGETTENVAPFEFVAGNSPCQDEHRCCFRQGPQSVPTPARSRLSQEIVLAEIAELNPAHSAESQVSLASVLAPALPPGLLGMVLRV